MIVRRVIAGALLTSSLFLLSGCGRSPHVSFYTLGSPVGVTKAVPEKGAPSVSVATVTLPDIVDRPQLVEFAAGNRVEILETHRWAEPLKSAVARLLAGNLSAQLGSDMVTAYPQSSAGNPDFRIFVDIQRFETMDGAVTVDAIWRISKKNGEMEKSGRSEAREPRGRGGYEALILAYNRAIGSIGGDIAKAVRKEWPHGK